MYDCLHSCLPGPLDTWSELIFHIAHRLASLPTNSSSARRPFSLNESAWLTAGSARPWEYCKSTSGSSDCAVLASKLVSKRWWPFRNYKSQKEMLSEGSKGTRKEVKGSLKGVPKELGEGSKGNGKERKGGQKEFVGEGSRGVTKERKPK